MSDSVQAGPIPDNLDPLLQHRDTDPLPNEALVKFQRIKRDGNLVANYRWLLFDDGRWFLARHSNQYTDEDRPFDTDLPATPTTHLPAEIVAEVRRQLRAANFASQPPYQRNPRVEDGSYFVVTARVDGVVHESIYDAVYSPLIEFLQTLVSHGS